MYQLHTKNKTDGIRLSEDIDSLKVAKHGTNLTLLFVTRRIKFSATFLVDE